MTQPAPIPSPWGIPGTLVWNPSLGAYVLQPSGAAFVRKPLAQIAQDITANALGGAPATRSTAVCTVTLAAGTYPIGSLVAAVAGPPNSGSSNGAQFANSAVVVSTGAPVTAPFQAIFPGPTVAPAGTLTTIAEQVTGYAAITNPSDAVVGTAATNPNNIDTGPTQPLAQLIGVLANTLSELWGVAADCVTSIDRDNAEGDQLDNIGTLTGSLREAPSPSTVECSATFTAAGTYTAGSLVAALASSQAIQFANATDIVVPGLVGGLAVSPTNPYVATDVLFQALVTGPAPAQALLDAGVGHLTSLAAPVSGWTAIVDTAAPSLGLNLEDDTDYRTRQEQELEANGGATLPSVTSALLEIEGVFSVNVIENVNLTTDPATLLPGKSFEVFVSVGGSPSAALLESIAQTIWNEKPAGIQLVGTTTIIITDSGAERAVPFSLVTTRSIWATLTVIFSAFTAAQGAQATVAGMIKTAIINLSAGLDGAGDLLPPGTPGVLVPGGTVYGAPIGAAATASAGGGIATVVLVLIGTAPNPVNAAPIWGQNDAAIATALVALVTITASQIGAIALGNIVVVDAVTGTTY